jgi:nucleoside-diphosphate-sugar epimerase
MGDSNTRVVIIGGCGFVGVHLTLALAKKDFMILVLDVAPLPESLVYQQNILYQQYDMLLSENLPQILSGFKPGVVVDIAGWGMSGVDMLRERCFWINYDGTENILNACKSSGMNKFIFTSTYNVVFCGEKIENGNETMPYATKPLDKYSGSKTEAEKLVMKFNGEKLKNGKTFISSVIRPAAIYGEDEMRHLPRILEHIDSDAFKFRIGSAKVDWVHVENLVRKYPFRK